MKKLARLSILFIVLSGYFLLAKQVYAVCGIREPSGQCIRNSEPINGAILCTGTSSICCSPASDCPQAPEPNLGEAGGQCIRGIAGIQCTPGNICVDDICTPADSGSCSFSPDNSESAVPTIYIANNCNVSAGYRPYFVNDVDWSGGCVCWPSDTPGAQVPSNFPTLTTTSGGNPTSEQVQCPNRPGTVSTAIGCVDFNDINLTSQFFLRWGLGIAGGVALLLIGLAAYRIATSQGDPRRLQGGQELLLSAIGGLLMIVLSVYLLRFIGVDLLEIF